MSQGGAITHTITTQLCLICIGVLSKLTHFQTIFWPLMDEYYSVTKYFCELFQTHLGCENTIPYNVRSTIFVSRWLLGKFAKLVLSNNLGNFALDFPFHSHSDKVQSYEGNCPVTDFLCMTEMGKDTVSKCTKLLKYAPSQMRNVKEKVQEFCVLF